MATHWAPSEYRFEAFSIPCNATVPQWAGLQTNGTRAGAGVTRVEFVKLQRQEKAKHLCELAEFFFSEGNKVLITVSDENQAVTLDGFMWTWRKTSFIPHAYDNGAVDCLSEPILIEVGQRNPHGAEILIMGHPCPLEFMGQFRLVVDFAEMYDPRLAEKSRQRYVRYKEFGFAVAMR